MPVQGDRYRVVIKDSHLNWGTHRHTSSRTTKKLESYIQIPAQQAYDLNILAKSVYNCSSVEGTLNTTLLASGQQNDKRYAKQFESYGELSILANWLHKVCKAKVGDEIDVHWVSANDIELTFIRQ